MAGIKTHQVEPERAHVKETETLRRTNTKNPGEIVEVGCIRLDLQHRIWSAEPQKG